MNERRKMGKSEIIAGGEVLFPVPENIHDMPDGYASLISSIIEDIKKQHINTILKANYDMICMYWRIGKRILDMQQIEGWGTKVVDRMSRDLLKQFPQMHGFSPRNLKYMRKFAETYDYEFVQRVVAQIPWRSNIVLMEKLKDNQKREWYASKLLENGWSHNVLELQIQSNLMERSGRSINNFDLSVPKADSDMITQTFKDPYLFDFLGTDIPRRETDVEKKLTEHIQEFLLELGQGFSFVGRQVHLDVNGDDFFIDLLFYHLTLRCYVVVELKACEFEPGFVSQLNMYVNAVNHLLRHPEDKPSIGLLLVKGKNRTVVEYSLLGYTNPIGVSDWEAGITKSIPDELRSNLPTIEEIERELN